MLVQVAAADRMAKEAKPLPSFPTLRMQSEPEQKDQSGQAPEKAPEKAPEEQPAQMMEEEDEEAAAKRQKAQQMKEIHDAVQAEEAKMKKLQEEKAQRAGTGSSEKKRKGPELPPDIQEQMKKEQEPEPERTEGAKKAGVPEFLDTSKGGLQRAPKKQKQGPAAPPPVRDGSILELRLHCL